MLLLADEQQSYDEARERADAPSPLQQQPPSPQAQPSRYDAVATTSVLSFDDDSEIEEMELT